MDERVIQFRVGVMVLATLMITAILMVLFGGLPSILQQNYTIYIAFPAAPGVRPDTPIRKNGILIGRVKSVDFAEDLGWDTGGVGVRAVIDANRRLQHNEVAQIGGSLLGDAVVQIVPSGDPNLPTTALEPGDTMTGVATTTAMDDIDSLKEELTVAAASIARTSDDIGVLARKINNQMDNKDDQVARVINKLELTLDEIRRGMSGANEFLGDPAMKENLRKSLVALPGVISDLGEAVSGIRSTLELADQNLKNLDGLTRPLGQRGGQLVNNVERATAELDVVISQLAAFSTSLNSREGFVGQLLNDPNLYNELNSTITNVNDLTRELKPIVHDVRAFTDKISRHPELLGVRGAMRGSSGVK